MKRLTSWLCTLATQLSLCFALYVVLNLGQPQKLVYNGNGTPLDLYLISVRGGFRSLQEQAHLLKLMENVAKAYDVKFVVNISELGEDDPLRQNDTALVGPSSGMRDNLSNWLARTLKATNSNWCIVVGFHALVACEENEEQLIAKRINEPLHRIFVKFGVNVYLSQQGCLRYVLQDSVAYIGNPGLTKDNSHSDSANERYQVRREMTNGFLLHRLSSLEMVTYFVTSAGEIVNKIVVQQRGRQDIHLLLGGIVPLVPPSTGLVPLPV